MLGPCTMGLYDQGGQSTQSCCWYWKGTECQRHSEGFEMHLWVHWLFKKKIKSLLRVFAKHHVHVFVFMHAHNKQNLFAQPHGSIAINTEFQKKIPLYLTHSLLLHTAQAVNISHCSSSKQAEFPLSLKGAWMHGCRRTALAMLRQPLALLPWMQSSKGTCLGFF